MSTNFYMFTKKKELKPFFGSKLELVDEPEFGYELHIAKTSAGWQPLFEAHEQIRSVVDLKLLYDKGGVQIPTNMARNTPGLNLRSVWSISEMNTIGVLLRIMTSRLPPSPAVMNLSVWMGIGLSIACSVDKCIMQSA